MLPESHALLSSAECYMRVTLYCPVLNVTWESRFIVQCWMLTESHAVLSSAACYMRVTLYCPLLNVRWESRFIVTWQLHFIVQCWVLLESHSLLYSAECYLRVTLYCTVLSVTGESLFIVQWWVLLESHSLLYSAEYYVRITLGIIVHCWILGCFKSNYAISWPTQLCFRLRITLHVNVLYEYCNVKYPHDVSYNLWGNTKSTAAKTKLNVFQYSTWKLG